MKCNRCGKKIVIKNKIPMEDYCVVRKEWGYFSNKDGECHEFVLCEKCYDEVTDGFINMISIVRKREML